MTVDGWKPYIVKPFQEPMQTTMTGRDMNTENTTEDQEYDVVLDTLQKQRDILWKMTESNMNHDLFNIMDSIRLEHIDQLDKAMKLWKSRESIREVIRISDREHEAWRIVKSAI